MGNKRVSMGWWLLRLSAKILALLWPLVNFFSVTVNSQLKIIFVKKQKQTRERPTQGRGATFIITAMAVFTLEEDYSCEMGYPFDDSRQIGNTS